MRWPWRRRAEPASVESGAAAAQRRAAEQLARDRRTVAKLAPVADSLRTAAAENHFSERVRSIMRGENGAESRPA